MAAISGDTASIAAIKVIAAAAAAGLKCSLKPGKGAPVITLSGITFDAQTANTAAALAFAAGAAVRCPAGSPFPSTLADLELEELLCWDSRVVAPLVVQLVSFGSKTGSAGWDALKRMRDADKVGSACTCAVGPSYKKFLSACSCSPRHRAMLPLLQFIQHMIQSAQHLSLLNLGSARHLPMPRCCMLAALQTQRLHWRPYLESNSAPFALRGSQSLMFLRNLLHGLRLLLGLSPGSQSLLQRLLRVPL